MLYSIFLWVLFIFDAVAYITGL